MKRWIALLLACLCVCLLAGCKDKTEPEQKAGLTGTYLRTSPKTDRWDTLYFDADGTGVHEVYDRIKLAEDSFEWKLRDGKLTLTFDDGTVIEGRLEGDTVTVEEEGTSYEYEKASDARLSPAN